MNAIRRPWHHHWRAIFILVALAGRVNRLTDGVWTVSLGGGCCLSYRTPIQARSLGLP
jgi:hypothetical protein